MPNLGHGESPTPPTYPTIHPLRLLLISSSPPSLCPQILGTLDQGKGHLLVYESTELDKTFTHGLDVMTNLGNVVDCLYRRAQNLYANSR
jgi:26S proteasome regulatory subunit N6